jgi:UDP:flavonoid glycosyltransferase YjiC (YdhE family)
VRRTGVRAVIFKGRAGIAARTTNLPAEVIVIDEVPHDWLFSHVSCVIHHGGSGTTVTGLAHGKPTVVVPFKGDHFFWGEEVARLGVGPAPIPGKDLTTDNLASAILHALDPEVEQRASKISNQILAEKGVEKAVQSFHTCLNAEPLRCTLVPSRVAVWKVKNFNMQLSAMTAFVLCGDGLLTRKDLEL